MSDVRLRIYSIATIVEIRRNERLTRIVAGIRSYGSHNYIAESAAVVDGGSVTTDVSIRTQRA
ncbi:hypothetical protein SAMN04488061_1850 [Filomicrobium insigne]|nr:hypothetical protein SAMN04488061_1850 [Filomicrobium insigne]